MNAFTPLISLHTPEEKFYNPTDTTSSEHEVIQAQEDAVTMSNESDLEPYPDFLGSYQLTQQGLYFIDFDKQGNKKPMWLSSPFQITANTCNSGGDGWGRLIEYIDQANKVHRIVILMETLAADGHEMRRILQNGGLSISGNRLARERLLNYVQSFKPDRHMLSTNNTGWLNSSYVMPDRSFDIEGNDQVIYQNSHGLVSPYAQSGTLEDWKSHVSSLAVGNSRLILTISMGFAGSLMKLANVESGGIHLHGISSGGKTTAAKVACSIWGKHSGFMRQWLATGNGLEGIASVHNDCLLPLDELDQSTPRICANSIYMLANGQGKVRANSLGMVRPTQKWSVMILSTGEVTTEAHINRSGQLTKAGQMNRLVNVESDTGSGMELFENIHGMDQPSTFAQKLEQDSETYYGTVGVHWLEYLVHNHSACKLLVADYMQQFMVQRVPKDAQGQVMRVATRFALIAAAGEMATAHGLTGWQQGEVMSGVAQCFDNWLTNFGGTGNHEERAILSHVQSFMEAHGSSRFEDIGSHSNISNRMGYVKIGRNQEKLYLVYPQQFRSVICKGFDSKLVEKVLLKHGWLKPNERNGAVSNQRFPKQKETSRMYALTDKMLVDSEYTDLLEN